MPKVIFDYSKCNGVGECVDACPVEILEKNEDGSRCKPVDDEVENEEELKRCYDEVDKEKEADVTLEFEMPECVECLACEASCPNEAVSIEA